MNGWLESPRGAVRDRSTLDRETRAQTASPGPPFALRVRATESGSAQTTASGGNSDSIGSDESSSCTPLSTSSGRNG